MGPTAVEFMLFHFQQEGQPHEATVSAAILLPAHVVTLMVFYAKTQVVCKTLRTVFDCQIGVGKDTGGVVCLTGIDLLVGWLT